MPICSDLWRGRRPLFYGYLLAVMALATYPLRQPVGSPNDKVNHIAAFAVYYLFGRWAYPEARPYRLLLSGLAYGALIELIQLFIPYRSCELGDLLADAAGLAIAWAAVLSYQSLQKERRSRAS